MIFKMYCSVTLIFCSKYCTNAYFLDTSNQIDMQLLETTSQFTVKIDVKYNNILKHNSEFFKISIFHICKQIYPKEDPEQNQSEYCILLKQTPHQKSLIYIPKIFLYFVRVWQNTQHIKDSIRHLTKTIVNFASRWKDRNTCLMFCSPYQRLECVVYRLSLHWSSTINQ